MRTASRICLTLCALSLAAGAAADERQAASNRLIAIEVAILESSGMIRDADPQNPEDLLEKLREAERGGQLDAATRVKLTTIENVPASVQFGEQVAVATGRSRIAGPRGFGEAAGGRTAFATAFSREAVGTHIAATARVEPGGTILLELQVEQSRLQTAPAAPRGEGETEGDPSPPKTLTLTCHSTLRLKDGEPQIVQAMRKSGAGGVGTTLVIVEARAAEAGEPAAQGAADPPPPQVKVFALRNVEAESVLAVLKALYVDQDMAIAADARSNRLIVRGRAELLEEIEALAVRFDDQ